MAQNNEHDAIPATAAIAGHPLHPMLVPFPIAFLVGACGADFALLSTADPFWVRAAIWLIGAGIVTGAVAAIFGIIDFLSNRAIRSHSAAWVHGGGNAVVLLLSIWNLTLRWNETAATTTPSGGLTLSIIVVAILLVTGWLGGELAFRHRIGVIANGNGRQNSDEGRPVYRA